MLSYSVKRYVPLAVWIVVVFTIICIPLKIIGYNYLPSDDALRHAAKAVSGKTWPEILVMRSDFAVDPNPGWHAILGGVHRWLGFDPDKLVVFSVVVLMLLVSACVLPWLRRPEAWLATLLAAAVFIPGAEQSIRFHRFSRRRGAKQIKRAEEQQQRADEGEAD